MIDRAGAQEPSPSTSPSQSRRRGRHLGPLPLTPAVVLVGIALLGSGIYILYVVTQVKDQQIPLLGAGFAVMGAAFVAIAIGTLVGVWRAASRSRAGRALGLAVVGGVAALLAIGCFTFTVLSGLLWQS